jgi:hypothetical protein
MARLPQDEVAWSHVLRQHANKPKTEGFFRAFYPPLTGAASALDGLVGDKGLDTAYGPHLDLIGSIVGITRDIPNGVYIAFFGFQSQPAGRAFGVARMRHDGEPIATSYTAADEEYRTMIRAKIALNNGHGTASEIAAALRRAFDVDLVSVRDGEPGVIEAWIGRIPSADDTTEALVDPLLPRAAGVRINYHYYTPAFFGFEGQPGATGFNQGAMARASSSNLNPL